MGNNFSFFNFGGVSIPNILTEYDRIQGVDNHKLKELDGGKNIFIPRK